MTQFRTSIILPFFLCFFNLLQSVKCVCVWADVAHILYLKLSQVLSIKSSQDEGSQIYVMLDKGLL